MSEREGERTHDQVTKQPASRVPGKCGVRVLCSPTLAPRHLVPLSSLSFPIMRVTLASPRSSLSI